MYNTACTQRLPRSARFALTLHHQGALSNGPLFRPAKQPYALKHAKQRLSRDKHCKEARPSMPSRSFQSPSMLATWPMLVAVPES